MSVVINSNHSNSSGVFSRTVAFSLLLTGGIILVLARKAISELRSPVSSEATYSTMPTTNDIRYTTVVLPPNLENKSSYHANGKRQHVAIPLTEPLEEAWKIALRNWTDQVEKDSPEYNDRVAASKKIQECQAGELALDLSHTQIRSFEGIEGILADLDPSCEIFLPSTLNDKSLVILCQKVKEAAGPVLKIDF